MPTPFDPYYKWLGIPPDEQPPDHYRLLAIQKFESDPEVIERAADQRMAFLRTLKSGQHAADPLPVLMWGDGIEPDEVEKFDEMAAGAGALQRFPLQLLLSRLYDLS